MFATLECQTWDKLCVPWFLRALGFYSSVESTFISRRTRCFLVGKILINTHISWDPFHLGLCWLGLIVEHELFPFEVSWRPLRPYRCHLASLPVTFVSFWIGIHPSWRICPSPYPSFQNTIYFTCCPSACLGRPFP